jgi:glycosyltransferase involved in cell wall biosynthesis
MRVLLINNCHFRRGGADVVYLNTGELLRKNGHEVSYFSTKSAQNEPTDFSKYFIEDFDALKLGFIKQTINTPRKLYSQEAKRNLNKLIENERPDIAHIHLYKGGLTASILPVLKRNHIPTVITLHDFSLLCPRNIFLDGNDNICEKCLTSHPFNCVINRCNRKNIFYSIISFVEFEINNKFFRPELYFNKIISVCKFNYEKHQIKLNIRERLVLLYNFSKELDNNFPDHIKGEYFLFYGRLSKEKGILTLIDAWQRLGSRFKLKIAGKGDLLNEVARKIESHNEGNIELLGFKSGTELHNLIKHSSFIIVPSECYENNPMTIIEGYSLGKPVIATNVGGIPEIISEGETGFLFELKNIDDLVAKVKHVNDLSDREYEIISKNARQFAEKSFSSDNHYIKLKEIYSEVIEKNH